MRRLAVQESSFRGMKVYYIVEKKGWWIFSQWERISRAFFDKDEIEAYYHELMNEI